MEDIRFEGAGGVELVARSWRPATPKAVLIVAHGLKSHSGRYAPVAERLVEAGYAVYAADMRGHGRSMGERFWFDFADLLADLDRFVALVRELEHGHPLFLLGHSAGGALATAWAVRNQDALTGVISESFAQEFDAPAFAIALLKGVAALAPRLKVLDLPYTQFSRDPAVVRSMTDDPLIVHGKGPAHVVAELARNAADFASRWGELRIPVLILHGTADKATAPSGSQHFYDGVGATDKTLKLYEGAVHDLLADTDKDTVFRDLVTWMDARIG